MPDISVASKDEMNKGVGTKDDWGKPKMGQIPPYPLTLLAEVLTFGGKKYSYGNWLNGMDWDRPYDALQRHLNAWWGGEELDPESKIHHLGHALCCLMFLTQYTHTHTAWDNRLKFNDVRTKEQENGT
jgi:hypothetical protein